MTREELQAQAISLIENNSNIALQWCTGLGKSRAAIGMINNLIDRNPDRFLKVLLVVAETAHKSNWKIEFDKWGLKTCHVTIECYASLVKYRKTDWDIIIFDEAHHLDTDIKFDILNEIKAINIIMLSATLPISVIQGMVYRFGKFKIFGVSLKQAIEWGILPEPKVYLIPLALDNTYKNCTVTEEWGRKERRVRYRCKLNERWEYIKNKKKYPDAILEMQCTQRQKYDYLTLQFEYWKKRYMVTRQEAFKNKWLQAGSKRKRFLGECKTEAARVLLDKLKDRRFICFCTSIEQAELLGGRNAIHSEKDDPLATIDRFNEKKINSLFAVGMLQEGQNLVDIEAGIIIQLDGKERAFIQKFGRSMRSENPVQFVFYYKNTMDTNYLENVLEEIDEEYIMKINNLNDFNMKEI